MKGRDDRYLLGAFPPKDPMAMSWDDLGGWVRSRHRTEAVLKELHHERNNQDREYGNNRVLPHGDWSLLVGEELGEVAKAILEGNVTHARSELVQAGALIVAWVESIDNESSTDGRKISHRKAT